MENHASFLKRLERLVDEKKITRRQFVITDWAYINAKYGHRNQKRDDGTRYFEHLRATALILIDELKIYDPEMIQTALMHYMLEDSYLLDKERIKILFGPNVAGMVFTISMPPESDERFSSKQERLDFYHERMKYSPIKIKIIKLCDRLHNSRTLGNCTPEKKRRKIAETIEHYLPLIEDVAIEYPGISRVLRREFNLAIANLEL